MGEFAKPDSRAAVRPCDHEPSLAARPNISGKGANQPVKALDLVEPADVEKYGVMIHGSHLVHSHFLNHGEGLRINSVRNDLCVDTQNVTNVTRFLAVERQEGSDFTE
jgi:hypothetical protein